MRRHDFSLPEISDLWRAFSNNTKEIALGANETDESENNSTDKDNEVKINKLSKLIITLEITIPKNCLT